MCRQEEQEIGKTDEEGARVRTKQGFADDQVMTRATVVVSSSLFTIKTSNNVAKS